MYGQIINMVCGAMYVWKALLPDGANLAGNLIKAISFVSRDSINLACLGTQRIC